MPLYMDEHKHVEGLTAEAVAGAHKRDVETQAKYGVKYHKYWFDKGSGKVFCLVEAPSKEAAAARTPGGARTAGRRDHRGQRRRVATGLIV